MENNQNHNPHPDLDNHHHHPWDTWEDLLLGSAVNRHGFNDWDAVAMELQSRTNRLLSAPHCEQRFHDLSRRFADQCNAAAASDHVPWLDELRKLRVAELRREVQRHDVSILSLQLEVKRLEDEKAKENSVKEDEKPDPVVSGEKRPGNDKGGEQEVAGPANSEPEVRRLDESTSNTDKLQPTAGEESDRENQSVNESNSTDSRFEVAKTGEGEGDVKLGPGPPPVHAGPNEPDPVPRKRKPGGAESNNGSYDTVAKVPTSESVPPSEERKAAEEGSSELSDSVAAAHSGDGGTRESSDVQSSASLTRRRKTTTQRRKEVSGEVAMVKSEPLVGVWELIKGHENISFFERRLENQDSDRYKDMVRQHVDLETIQLRLQKGSYSSCTSAFFRDLLLLFTNATVFFPEGSTESRAAQQLHRLVISEMRSHGQSQSDPSPQKSDSLPPNAPPPVKPDSLLSKHPASAPILVCRKRSSSSGKPSPATSGQKSDQQTIANDKKEKPPSDAKPPLKPSNSETDEEEEAPKTKEKPVTTGARSLRRSNKNLNTNTGNNKKPSSNSTTTKGGSSTSKSTETLKLEKRKTEGLPDKKRNAAADFLKRIKRNPSTDVLKSHAAGGGGGSNSSSKGGGGGGVKEQKKMVNSSKADKGKEKASRNNNNEGGPVSGDKRSKNTTENSSQSKRSVGRPPKKAAETTPVSAKRGRESGASGGKDKRPKKRSKK